MARTTTFGDTLGVRLNLRLANDEWFGLCPLSCIRVPSFHLTRSGDWRCSGCGQAGTAWTLLARLEGLALPDAIAALRGQSLDGAKDGTHNRDLRVNILEANAFTAEYYRRFLCDETEAQEARDYVTRRRLSLATLEEFGIGYAPATTEGKADFRRAFAGAGFTREIGIAAGILTDSVKGVYPFLRARITVPMRSETGEVIAFGGRAIATIPGSRKYVNTSTTPVHRKGASLFALDRARNEILRTGEVIVVEGYLDCIALHAAGFRNAVAALGTSFTEEQAYSLARLGASVIACFDADDAGTRAFKKSSETALRIGMSLRRLVLPDGVDPDDLIRDAGADAFRTLLQQAEANIA
jgi:DNA primase